ncbi:Multidrug resistance-associated protein 1 [Entophlyctis sp. JEL0112]|nr:Multidrug resistance-associated protein 1 [Entophlyctis sp. JEL0112]
MSDMFAIADDDKSEKLADEFEAVLAETRAHSLKSGKHYDKTVLRAFLWQFRTLPLLGLLKLVSDFGTVMNGFVMRSFLQSLIASQSDNPPPLSHAFLYAFGFCTMAVVVSFLNNYAILDSNRRAVAAKGMLTAVVYRKSLKLNGVGRAKFSSGKLLNIVSTDIGRIESLTSAFILIWSAPFLIIETFIFVLYIIGIPGVAGIAFILICMPFQGYLIKRLMAIRRLLAPVTDKRMKLSSEILQGIRIIKYFGWESQFMRNVENIRLNEELVLVRHAAYVRAVLSCIGFVIPAVAASITFLVYGAVTTSFQSVQIFSTLALFNQLRQTIMWLPYNISFLGDSFVSFQRLQELMDAPEVEFKPIVNSSAQYGVEIQDGEFAWESEDSQSDMRTSTLRNINMKAPLGGLTAIVGAVGSGKSSLLSALISELKCINGTVVFSGSVGYASQQAWIVNATVRENIVFGRPFDEQIYWRVVEAACLIQDFEILPNADMSEIGERGINLSGGQRQRISIARLMYTNHDIVLLDDPLSAVDAHVGRKLFEGGIRGILAGNTRLLVTHQLHFVPLCDWVVFMKDGEIAEQGKYEDLVQAGSEFSALMTAYGGESPSEHDNDGDRQRVAIEDFSMSPVNEVSPVLNKKETVHQIQVELQASGNMSRRTLLSYFKASGSDAFLAITIFSLLLTQATRLANDLWLAEWSENTYPGMSKQTYIGIYAGLSLLQSIALLFYSMMFAIGGISASKHLHDSVFKRVIHCAVGFFDQTPVGRIINRLSRDIDYVDNSLYDSIRLFFYAFLQVVSAFFLLSYITTGIFLAALLPMLAIYCIMQLLIRTSSREIKRIEAVSRSPMFAHISECMSGLATIRAYNDQERFILKTETLADCNAAPLYLVYVGQRWMALRNDFIGSVLVLATALYAAVNQYTINPSLIGLGLSYLFQTVALMNMLIYQAVEMENQLNAVERLFEYTKLPVETQDGVAASKNWSWLKKGSIEFQNVQMRYQPNLPLVLNNVNFRINGGEKIGIVGRTGSGKSSLMQALFRIVELVDGCIKIDNVDISTLSLHALRTSLAIIPQDPVLFSGPLRKNLDPAGKYTDAELWDVLERCGMRDAVADMSGKLDCILVENAENVSVGQRQLLCLARACLQRPKIIVLDECTASVDMRTDDLIQKTIRDEFKDATTLTVCIAHRLNTIITSSKILVMGEGRVLEFDTPYALLHKENSHFASMVKETGESNEKLLRSLIE